MQNKNTVKIVIPTKSGFHDSTELVEVNFALLTCFVENLNKMLF